MKYNTYDDIINGGPRLVEVAKHRGKKKALHFRKKEEALAIFFFKSIKKAQGAFYCFSWFRVFLLTPFHFCRTDKRLKGLPDTLETKRIS